MVVWLAGLLLIHELDSGGNYGWALLNEMDDLIEDSVCSISTVSSFQRFFHRGVMHTLV